MEENIVYEVDVGEGLEDCTRENFNIEGEEFNVEGMCDQLEFSVEERGRRLPVFAPTSSSRPSYLATCYDEMSRNYVHIAIAKQSSSPLPVIPYLIEQRSPNIDNTIEKSLLHSSRILHHYNPGSVSNSSNFRLAPLEGGKHFLARRPMNDTNILLKGKQFLAR